MLNFESFFDLKKPILEYNDQEAKEILNLLKSNYRNRRIILTKDEFTPKTIPHHQQQIRAKPKGTWYSLGEYWARWLTSEMPHWWGNYNNVYMLDLDYSKILRINNEAKMNAFVNEYQVDNYSVDWDYVAQDYSGIEIIPMVWGKRNSYWYDGWDIPSGCIWDEDAIKGWKKIAETTPL